MGVPGNRKGCHYISPSKTYLDLLVGKAMEMCLYDKFVRFPVCSNDVPSSIYRSASVICWISWRVSASKWWRLCGLKISLSYPEGKFDVNRGTSLQEPPKPHELNWSVLSQEIVQRRAEA